MSQAPLLDLRVPARLLSFDMSAVLPERPLHAMVRRCSLASLRAQRALER